MIQSFKDKETERLFSREFIRKLPAGIARVALRKLLMIDAALTVGDLRVPPGNRLERLRGNRLNQYSIRVNDQWRVCFKWQGSNAYDVEITDYH